MAATDLGTHYLATCLRILRGQKRMADRAIAQLSPDQLHQMPHEDGNSVVVLMKHMAGNMLSRWTDFLSTDGEKPDRQRDGEFVDDFTERAALDAHWEGGWRRLFDTVDALVPADLEREVTIRGEPHSVVEALERQISHYGYHVGQIVQQARSMKGAQWKTLSIPRGESDTFSRKPFRGA